MKTLLRVSAHDQHMMMTTLIMIRQVHIWGLPGPERFNSRALGFSLPKRHLAPCLTGMHMIYIVIGVMMTMIILITMMMMILIMMTMITLIMMTMMMPSSGWCRGLPSKTSPLRCSPRLCHVSRNRHHHHHY